MCREMKDAQRESKSQHIKPTNPNIECLHKMRNSKGLFQWHTQQQTQIMKLPPKGAQLQGG
jgi:hypothetical protein